MQFIKLSAIAIAVAAAAAAERHHGMPHFHHRRQMNATSADISTTLTVFQTVVHTITSCAPTITNCPARSAAGSGVITDIVVLTTTECPIVAAESIASSIISAAGGSSSAFTEVPATTAVINALGTEGSDTTLTYTLGTGSSTTVMTTTIKHTSTETAYVTQYITMSKLTPAAASGDVGGQIISAGAGSQSDQTTTITSSSTITKTITVKIAPSHSIPPGNGVTTADSGSEGGNCVPVTVTVALATVTVTYAPMGASPTSSTFAPSAEVNKAPAVGSSTAPPSPTPTAEGTSVPALSPIIPCSTAPYGNWTEPFRKPSHGKGTGFLTLAKPSNTLPAY